MNTLVDKPQLVRVVIQYLNMKFGNLTPKTSSKRPESVFYVNSYNEIMVEYDKKNEYVWVHYDQIWSKIESLFSLNYSETQSIMKHWLERDYNLKNLKLLPLQFVSIRSWREITI